MRLLFDQNLSFRLVRRLDDLFPSSEHVRPLNLDRAPDERIWEYAKVKGFCIVTQDSDYADRSRLYGSPPKVVWLRCGNCTPLQVEAILRRDAALIEELGRNANIRYVELW